MAGGLGFEPRLAESESAVLPLNYPPTHLLKIYNFMTRFASEGKSFAISGVGTGEIGRPSFWVNRFEHAGRKRRTCRLDSTRLARSSGSALNLLAATALFFLHRCPPTQRMSAALIRRPIVNLQPDHGQSWFALGTHRTCWFARPRVRLAPLRTIRPEG
jgi:hypothetical protein